jgi:hypothetical protein
MGFIGHLLPCGEKEAPLDQFAEESNKGLLLRGRESRPKFLRHPGLARRWRRGGTAQTLESDMRYFLLEYCGAARTSLLAEAMPPRRLYAAIQNSDRPML